MVDRNMHASNALLKLGGGLDHIVKGKASVPGSKALKNAQIDEYYPHSSRTKMPNSSNRGEYVTYSKDDFANKNQLDESTLKKEAMKYF